MCKKADTEHHSIHLTLSTACCQVQNIEYKICLRGVCELNEPPLLTGLLKLLKYTVIDIILFKLTTHVRACKAEM